MYQFILWLVPTLENFPRSQKFLLGDRLQTEAMAVLDCLIDATYSRERQQHRERPAAPRQAPLISPWFAEAASDEAASRRCGC
jgi:hypothetical protein